MIEGSAAIQAAATAASRAASAFPRLSELGLRVKDRQLVRKKLVLMCTLLCYDVPACLAAKCKVFEKFDAAAQDVPYGVIS